MANVPLDVLSHNARTFDDHSVGLRPLIDAIGDARLVLIGEASHGTHEFYDIRAELTKTLIAERGFNIVAVEADWPDAYHVNRWVRGVSSDSDAVGALSDFTRFPRWMWRNTDVVAFIEWLRDANAARPLEERAGFYGLDLYSLHRSIEAVLQYLRKVDPARQHARGCAMTVSRRLATTRKPTATRPRSGCLARVKTMSPHSCSSCSARRWSMRVATVGWPRTNISLPNRTHDSLPTPRLTTAQCLAAGLSRGTFATST